MGASLSATEPNRLAVAAISHVVHFDRETYVQLKNEVYASADDSEDRLVSLKNFNEALALVRVHPKDKEIFDRLFVLFDRAGDGVVSSREIIVGCSLLVKAPARKKLQFALELFDEEGAGKVSKDDLLQTLRWLSKTSAFFGDKQPTSEAMASLVERVFNKITDEAPEDSSYAIYVDPMLDHPTLTDYIDQVEDSTRLQDEPIE